jgi:hypothetical protein
MSIRGRMRSTTPFGVLASGVLGASAALLVSCGASTGKLIPVANSEPLQKDFEEVAHAAESGRGSCASTETAIRKAEADYGALPGSLDAGLRRRLREGIDKLRADALELCVQPGTTTQSTTATQPPTTATTPTTTQPPTTQTTPTTTTPTTTSPEGGTPAPKEGEPESEEAPIGKRDHKRGDGEANPSGGAAPGGEGGK